MGESGSTDVSPAPAASLSATVSAPQRGQRRLRARAGMWVLLLICGALPVLAFPAPNLEWLAWFGLVPGLVLIIRAPGPRQGAWRAWWLGTGYLIAALHWLTPELGPAVLLIAAVFGGTWVPYGIAARTLLRPPLTPARTVAALVIVPSCWLVAEWLRSWQALGGPWAVYGAGQWQHPTQLGLAALGGVWLISVAIVAANVGIVLALAALRPSWLGAPSARPRRPRRVALVVAGVAAVVVAVGAGPLAYALRSEVAPVRQVTVALVQPGRYRSDSAQDAATGKLTAAASHGGTLAGARADLIVWGESSETNELARDPGELRRIEALSAADGAQILVNQDSLVPGKGKQKVAMLIGPHGVRGDYVKSRLVPFGEYIPLRNQLGWLTSISKAAPTNTVSGGGATLMHARDRSGRPLPIGVLICFESAFPDMSRVDAGLGAQLLVYQSSMATFQGTWGPDQHAALAAVRAVEAGRPVVQAALTGDSVAFDSRGRRLAWLGQSGRGVVIVPMGLPAASERTPYDRFGDYVPWTAMGIGAAAMVGFAVRARRNRR